jgi:hypothetical protein
VRRYFALPASGGQPFAGLAPRASRQAFQAAAFSGPGLRRSDSITNAAPAYAQVLSKSSAPKQHQDMMRHAMANIGKLNLSRANRIDVLKEQSGLEIPLSKSIYDQREKRDTELYAGLEPYARQGRVPDMRTLQRHVARATGKVYEGKQGFEAYCADHTYLLLDELLKGGMDQRHLLAIDMDAPALDPIGADHAFLLYCSKKFPHTDHWTHSDLRDFVEANPEDCVVLDAWRKKDKVVVLSGRGDFDSYCGKVMSEIDSSFKRDSLNVRPDPVIG